MQRKMKRKSIKNQKGNKNNEAVENRKDTINSKNEK